MKKTDIFYSALVVTALSVNPLFLTPLNATTSQSSKTNTLSYSIANILHNRGIDEEVAHTLADDFFEAQDDNFDLMLNNLVSRCSTISKSAVLDYISSIVLQRQTIELDSYASLVKMAYTLTSRMPSEETLKELKAVASTNYSHYSASINS